MNGQDHIHRLAAQIIEQAAAANIMIATAESCTGGLIAAALTEISGASAVVDRGFITYSNAAKSEMLGVPPALIKAHGAVSGEVASAMASGALENAHAHLAVSVTGVAGPMGGTNEKPIGLVWFGIATIDGARAEKRQFEIAPRNIIRANAVETALHLLLGELSTAY